MNTFVCNECARVGKMGVLGFDKGEFIFKCLCGWNFKTKSQKDYITFLRNCGGKQ